MILSSPGQVVEPEVVLGSIHLFDTLALGLDSRGSSIGKPGELFINHLYAFHQVLTPPNEPKLPPEQFLPEWSTAEISRMVFEESDTDIVPYPNLYASIAATVNFVVRSPRQFAE